MVDITLSTFCQLVYNVVKDHPIYRYSVEINPNREAIMNQRTMNL